MFGLEKLSKLFYVSKILMDDDCRFDYWMSIERKTEEQEHLDLI